MTIDPTSHCGWNYGKGPLVLVNLHVVSPDLTGDGYINISDVGLFSENFFGEYHESADLMPDGTLDLADVALLARGLGQGCSA